MSKEKEEEKVFEEIPDGDASWSFAGKTPEFYSRHIRRSVPLYEEGHDLICQLSHYFVKEDSTCYEIGVSVGELLGKLASIHKDRKDCRWIGIDSEVSMIANARKNLKNFSNIHLEVADAAEYEFEAADLIVSYYCLQFIPLGFRRQVVNKIYQTLNEGGAFICFEKVHAPNARFQDITSALYVDYKLRREYTASEIIAKNKSLKGVLHPLSSRENLILLRQAGFENTLSVFKYLCFEGLLAIK